jgi:deazaflavin-dependent oxidoreductase (nitroreductase family)
LTLLRRLLRLVAALTLVVAVWVRLPNRLFYRDGRPTRIGKVVNHAGAVYSAVGLPPAWWVTLEVRGRRTGRTLSTTLVVGSYAGERYLVSMLGEESAWVRNVRAAGGRAAIHHGRRRQIVLREVPADQRAPILRAYLQRAPGARPHFPVLPTAPLAEFERIAARYPVFRITEADTDQ